MEKKKKSNVRRLSLSCDSIAFNELTLRNLKSARALLRLEDDRTLPTREIMPKHDKIQQKVWQTLGSGQGSTRREESCPSFALEVAAPAPATKSAQVNLDFHLFDSAFEIVFTAERFG